MKYNTNLLVFITWYQSYCSDLFLAVLSLLVWLLFFSLSSTLLPPSQQPPQPFAVEPPMSSSRHPWVPDLQPSSLRSFTLHRPLPLTSPLQKLLRLRFWRYHRDCLALIYKTVKASTPSETARAPTRRLKFLYSWSRATRVVTRLQAPPRATTRFHAPACTSFLPADVSPRWHHLPCHLLTSSLTRPLTCVDFSSGLTFLVQVLLTQFFV